MSGSMERRRELGEFLKNRRQHLVRSDLGLPAAGRRYTGLRREEVSYLSGVSITWYTWLEQGRKIMPSRQVLGAIARTLRLTGPEHAYILALSEYSDSQLDPIPSAVPADVERLLDAIGHLPAYVLAPNWTILAWTSTFAAVYPNITILPHEDRNLLWLVFTEPYMRDLLGDWRRHSARTLSEFRVEAGPRLGEPPFIRLIERLLGASEHFRVAWENHDIGGFVSKERVYHHPIVGDLNLEIHHINLSGNPDLHLVIYTPVPGTDAAAQLRQAELSAGSCENR